MIIVSQDRERFIDVHQGVGIEYHTERGIAGWNMVGGNGSLLGRYSDEALCKITLVEIIAAYESGKKVYRMP